MEKSTYQKMAELIVFWNETYNKLIALHKDILDLTNQNEVLKSLLDQVTMKKESKIEGITNNN